MSRVRVGHAEGLAAPLRNFMIVSWLLTVLSWVVAGLVWRAGFEERGGMWSRYDDRFADLTHYDTVFPYLHQERFFTGPERFAYPAPAAVVYDGLMHLTTHRLAAFLIFTVLLAVIPALVFGRKLATRAMPIGSVIGLLGTAVLTSWPLLFLLERANIESLLVLLTLVGSVAFWRKQPGVAACLWGLAAALKIYPAVLLVLFLSRRRIGAFSIGAGTMVATLLASFWFVGPTISFAARGTVQGISGFVGSYATRSREWELRHDHSFLAFLKQPLAIHRLHLSPDVSHLSAVYFLVAGMGIVVLYVTRFRTLPDLNQYILVVIAMVALPPVSYDYTLMHLYPSFGLLVLLLLGSEREARSIAALRSLFWCFTLILASENFVFWIAFHMNGMIKAAALFWAAVLLVRYPLPTLRSEDAIAPPR